MRGVANIQLGFFSVAAPLIGCSSQAPIPYFGPEIRLTVIGNPIVGATGLQYGTVEVSIEELRGEATGKESSLWLSVPPEREVLR